MFELRRIKNIFLLAIKQINILFMKCHGAEPMFALISEYW